MHNRMGRKEKEMLEINASPELCYALWLVGLALTLFMFSILSIAVHENARDKEWGTLSFFAFAYICGVYSILNAADHVSAWYNILAQLRGW